MPDGSRSHLAGAMLHAALADLAHTDHARRREARRWLLEDATCETCCQLLELEVETIRAGVRRRLDGVGPTMPRSRSFDASS